MKFCVTTHSDIQMIFRKIINWFLEKPYRQMITGAILVVVGIGIVYAINKANTGFFERILGIDLFNFVTILFALMCAYMVGLWLSERIDKKK